MKYPSGKIVEPKKASDTPELEVARNKMCKVTKAPAGSCGLAQINGGNASEVDTRNGGQFAGCGIYLTKEYDWVLVKDNDDCIVLLPLNKY